MPSDTGIHVGDVGTRFVATVTDAVTGVVIDISSATTMQMTFERPDASTFTRTASLLSGGTDGKMYYTTVTGDLDTAGRWNVQGYVEIPSGKWHTSTTVFKVFANL